LRSSQSRVTMAASVLIRLPPEAHFVISKYPCRNKGWPSNYGARITSGKQVNRKTALIKAVDGQQFDSYILPKWQEYRLQDVRAILVESWLSELPLAPPTRSKTRNILCALYEHAMRYGWATANPLKKVRQSATRLSEPDNLTAEEITGIVAGLQEPNDHPCGCTNRPP
jgi:site-specific recombinase XerD